MKLTDDIEIFHDGYWFQGKYNDTGFSISLNQQCSKEDAEQLLKELTQNQKLRELIEKRMEQCWKNREKFKKEKNHDMLYYTNDILEELRMLLEESKNENKA